ncbi:MAG: DUF2007 domain-containing protein [Planctomycetales bacterium]|nr:DUF2007 domain-containing protein [bacterium]UNM07116.1 MAG: DUF2007 domain-containing protein [Planctomycetales bacterium]
MAKVSVYWTKSELMAQSVMDLLIENGISCMIQSDQVIEGGPRVHAGHILVFAEDEGRAREQIGGFLGTLGELAESGSDTEDDNE